MTRQLVREATIRTVRFSGTAEQALLADIFPSAGNAPLQLVVAVSSGAWRVGPRSEMVGWDHCLAHHGFALATAGYRRSTEEKVFPAKAEGIAAAVRHFAEEGGAHGVDPAQIALFGTSSGGHLAASVTPLERFPMLPIKALTGIYVIYNLFAQSRADHVLNAAPGDDFIERMLGCVPCDDQRLYHHASRKGRFPIARRCRSSGCAAPRPESFARTVGLFRPRLCGGHAFRSARSTCRGRRVTDFPKEIPPIRQIRRSGSHRTSFGSWDAACRLSLAAAPKAKRVHPCAALRPSAGVPKQ